MSTGATTAAAAVEPVAAVEADRAVRTHGRQTDWGKVVLVPLFAVLLLGNTATLVSAAGRTQGSAALVASVTGSVLTIAFCVLVIVAYVRRGPARATTGSPLARTAAVVATFLPVTLPMLGVRAGTETDAVAAVLITTGLGWSLWALAVLGRNLSVVAQARDLERTGPYRWVRHPLYLGEIVVTLGIALRGGVAVGYVAWALLVVLQLYRASVEERLLLATLPGYVEYAAGTRRLLPGLY
jgi:protein-S-isoprenylcysteine O-methyltransferase Ste14